MARYIAKNMVAAELTQRCEVQLSYSIGVAEPTSFYIKTFGTGKVSDEKLTEIAKAVFPIRPGEILAHLDLKNPDIVKLQLMDISEENLILLLGRKLIWLKNYKINYKQDKL